MELTKGGVKPIFYEQHPFRHQQGIRHYLHRKEPTANAEIILGSSLAGNDCLRLAGKGAG
jgi:hypothetical protein